MKMKHYLPGVLFCLSMSTLSVKAQDSDQADSTGLPGDNFSLQGALEMFKKANSVEEFEKLLNDQNSNVNNLDLNEDGITDYIKVINKKENNVQVFVLQAQISEKESQDIAVIELEKTGKDNAVIQIVGDEDIYGEETIIEPSQEDGAYIQLGSELAKGPNAEVNAYAVPDAIIVNVWAWPCVRFVYAPAFTLWVSPWTWRVHPVWYRPWRPYAWHVYRPMRYVYRPHYVVVHTNRIAYAPRIYKPMRVTSVTVTNRHRVAVTNYRTTRTVNRSNGRYEATRQRTTATGPRGTTVNRQRTTVSGPRGNTVNQKTTTVTGPRGNSASRTKTTVRKRKR